MTAHQKEFFQIATHPVKFRIFLFSKIPSAFFSGIRIKQLDEEECMVTVPYKWFSKNPFRSTYFACLSMAAEMSTGALAMACVYKQNPAVSMLVINLQAVYFKKATGLTTFTCKDGKQIQDAIQKSITTGNAHMIIARSIGKNDAGEIVAEFQITWSFKVKKLK
jgi:Domain of unknown function (DUF4442)